MTPSQTQPKLNLDPQCNTPSTSKSLNSTLHTEPDSSGCLPSFHLISHEQDAIVLPCLVLVQPVLCIVSSCLISMRMSLSIQSYLTLLQTRSNQNLESPCLPGNVSTDALYMQRACWWCNSIFFLFWQLQEVTYVRRLQVMTDRLYSGVGSKRWAMDDGMGRQ